MTNNTSTSGGIVVAGLRSTIDNIRSHAGQTGEFYAGGFMCGFRSGVASARLLGAPWLVRTCGLVGYDHYRHFKSYQIHGLSPDVVPVDGPTRRNRYRIRPDGTESCEVVVDGYSVSPHHLAQLDSRIRGYMPSRVVYTGSMPKGAQPTYYSTSIRDLLANEVEVGLDTRGGITGAVIQALRTDPEWLGKGLTVKTNIVEFGDMFNLTLDPTDYDLIRKLCEEALPMGTMIVTLGREHGILGRDPLGPAWNVKLPHPKFIKFVCSTGCGDATKMAFHSGREQGMPTLDALQFAVRVATAQTTTLEPGHVPVEHVEPLMEFVKTTEVC